MYKYLASPYSHPEPRVREERYQQARACLGWFLKGSVWVYSPIVHTHPLAVHYDLPREFEFWQNYNHAMICGSNGLLVLLIPGWKESKGVEDELKFANSIGLTIAGVAPDPDHGYQFAEIGFERTIQ